MITGTGAPWAWYFNRHYRLAIPHHRFRLTLVAAYLHIFPALCHICVATWSWDEPNFLVMLPMGLSTGLMGAQTSMALNFDIALLDAEEAAAASAAPAR